MKEKIEMRLIKSMESKNMPSAVVLSKAKQAMAAGKQSAQKGFAKWTALVGCCVVLVIALAVILPIVTKTLHYVENTELVETEYTSISLYAEENDISLLSFYGVVVYVDSNGNIFESAADVDIPAGLTAKTPYVDAACTLYYLGDYPAVIAESYTFQLESNFTCDYINASIVLPTFTAYTFEMFQPYYALTLSTTIENVTIKYQFDSETQIGYTSFTQNNYTYYIQVLTKSTEQFLAHIERILNNI